MGTPDLISSLKDSCFDEILAIRQNLGAALHRVFIITRTWEGLQIGDGSYLDEVKEVLPTPGIKDYSHNLHVTQGGSVQAGDLMLQMISKNQFPDLKEITCLSDDPAIEMFYQIGDFFYRVITVVEKQLYWNVQVRRIADQTRGING